MRISHWRLAVALLATLGPWSGSAYAQQAVATAWTSTPTTDSYYASTSSTSNFLAGADEAAPAPSGNSSVSCSSCNGCQVCCDDLGNWRDNTLVWIGADGYKSLGDTVQPPGGATGFMDSAGFVGGFNTGFRLIDDSPIRGQIGGSYGVYDLKGRDTVSLSAAEQQFFITAGVSKRSNVLADDRISWGLVYDQFFAHQWGLQAAQLYVGQIRGLVGYALNERNEVGVWGTFHTTQDASVTGQPSPLRAMNQYNAYWRHNYDFGGQTMLYFGGVDRADVGSWQVGTLGQAPLNDRLALYGNMTFAFPGSATGAVGSNELEWNLGVGLMYSFGCKAFSPSVSGPQGLPLLPVANNGSFLITN